MGMKAEVIVTPKKSVLDPQGEAVRKAIHSLGLEQAKSVRVGKYIEIELDEKSPASLRSRLEGICRDLLSNPIIEDYCLHFSSDVKTVVKSTVQSKKPKKLSK